MALIWEHYSRGGEQKNTGKGQAAQPAAISGSSTTRFECSLTRTRFLFNYN